MCNALAHRMKGVEMSLCDLLGSLYGAPFRHNTNAVSHCSEDKAVQVQCLPAHIYIPTRSSTVHMKNRQPTCPLKVHQRTKRSHNEQTCRYPPFKQFCYAAQRLLPRFQQLKTAVSAATVTDGGILRLAVTASLIPSPTNPASDMGRRIVVPTPEVTPELIEVRKAHCRNSTGHTCIPAAKSGSESLNAHLNLIFLILLPIFGFAFINVELPGDKPPAH